MMVKLAMSQMQTLAVVFMASLWSSAVHCHVLGQVNHGDDSDTDEDTNWPVLCPDDTFYDRTQELCVRCSQCPMNQVIISPCQGLYDTQCGPFIIFQNFGSSDSNDQGEEKKTDDIESNKNLDAHTNRKHLKKKSDTTSEIDTVVSEEKSFSLTLMIILGIVLAIFFLVIGITCYVRHKSSRPTKEGQCEYKLAPVPVSV